MENSRYIPLSERKILWIDFMKIDQKLLTNSDLSGDRYWETAHPLTVVNTDLQSRELKADDPCPYCRDKYHMGTILNKFPKSRRNIIVACGLKMFDLLYCHACGIQMDNIAQADHHYRTICESEHSDLSWQNDLYEHKRARTFVLSHDITDIINMELEPQRAWALLVLWNQCVGDSQGSHVKSNLLRMTYDYYIYFFSPMSKNYDSIMSYISRTAVLSDNSDPTYYSVERQLRRRSAIRFDEEQRYPLPHLAVTENVRLSVFTEMADKTE